MPCVDFARGKLADGRGDRDLYIIYILRVVFARESSCFFVAGVVLFRKYTARKEKKCGWGLGAIICGVLFGE